MSLQLQTMHCKWDIVESRYPIQRSRDTQYIADDFWAHGGSTSLAAGNNIINAVMPSFKAICQPHNIRYSESIYIVIFFTCSALLRIST